MTRLSDTRLETLLAQARQARAVIEGLAALVNREQLKPGAHAIAQHCLYGAGVLLQQVAGAIQCTIEPPRITDKEREEAAEAAKRA